MNHYHDTNETPPLASRCWLPLLVLFAVLCVHLLRSPYSEPWKNNDETRHVMTGVFIRDAIYDLPESLSDPKGYAVRYYTQYPALGLLVWPPLFYLIEGLAMALLGIDYAIARLVLTGFVLLTAWYVHRFASLILRTRAEAAMALALFLLGYLVLELSRFVLLEMPTLAFVLGSVVHFEAYLRQPRRGDAYLACGLAACAALTRFDAVVLLPYFALRLLMLRRWLVLLDRPVVVGIVAAAMLVGPYYVLTWLEYRTGLSTAAAQGTGPQGSGALAAWNLVEYLVFIRWQVGFAALFFFVVGAVLSAVHTEERSRFGPGYALFLATYVTFVPLAEPEMRHAVYWVPALAVFAVRGTLSVWERYGRRSGTTAVCLLLGGTTLQAVWEPGWYVYGYDAAARHVLECRTVDRPILMDGVLNGGFIYQVRRHDPRRQVSVLRGDKLFYAVLSDPRGGYQQYAYTEDEILQTLDDYDPEWIVVEQPQLFYMHLEGAALLRTTLANHPERFRLERMIPLQTNHCEFATGRLELYRKLTRNPNPSPIREIPVLGLGRTLRNE